MIPDLLLRGLVPAKKECDWPPVLCPAEPAPREIRSLHWGRSSYRSQRAAGNSPRTELPVGKYASLDWAFFN